MKDDERRRIKLWSLAFAALLAAGWSGSRAQAADLDFTIRNASGRPILSVYVSPATVRSWGDDVLGRDDLAPGESARITLPDRAATAPCLWDVKFVYRGGTSAVSRANACTGEPVIAPR